MRPSRQSTVHGSITERLAPRLAQVRAYAAVSPPERLSEESGRPTAELIKLDANENPYGPTPRVREVIASFPHTAVYPDPEQRALREALARYTGFPPQQIVAGAGSDELIDLLVRFFVSPGDRVVTAGPTFGMYQFSTDMAGGVLVSVPRRADDFSLDILALRQALEGATLLFLASPNNPTGNIVTPKELEPLLATGVPVAVDEAYYEFSGRTVAGLLADYPNLFVLRTFSKWAGLAGLRVGYGLFPLDLAALLMRLKPPYNVGTVAQAAAVAALEDREACLERVGAIVRDREALAGVLATLPGVHVYPSEANFLLVRFVGRDTVALNHRLRQRGISLRRFDQPGLEDCLRVSVGRASDHAALLAALREELGAA
ncbi:MAG: histidinol-phosphate transaminase [Chloroflexi bacterium]|nr:histidinol-phosphate transaminase [Chloroflexota bacterium]